MYRFLLKSLPTGWQQRPPGNDCVICKWTSQNIDCFFSLSWHNVMRSYGEWVLSLSTHNSGFTDVSITLEEDGYCCIFLSAGNRKYVSLSTQDPNLLRDDCWIIPFSHFVDNLCKVGRMFNSPTQTFSKPLDTTAQEALCRVFAVLAVFLHVAQ